ncbi:MAG TPA: DNA primase, partial [Gemmatimonadaceae bacterium]
SVQDHSYKCFVCGESGDVFTFVQKHLGMSFLESVKWVGAKVGVEVRETSRRSEERDRREPLWEINGTAADFFVRQLWESPEAKIARDYLASRGLTFENAERFGLGYSPRDTAAMRAALEALGFDADRQLAAGLLIASVEKPEPRARFRGRLMFPIYDATGHVVGFGGRVLGDGQPKYLNSAETEAFSKGQLLYGLNWAKQAARKADRLIVVEGYFDAIRLMLAGINEVVAPLGTALTEQQTELIKKYTKNVFLLYDSDQAGLKATFRAGDRLLAAGISPRVITLPQGEDPDTYVAKVGAEGFERSAAAGVDIFDRKIQILERSGWFADLHRKREALDKLLPTIRLTEDPITRDLYIARTSEVGGVTREMLVRELQTPPRIRPAPRRAPEHASSPPPDSPDDTRQVRAGDRRSDHRRRGSRAERELVRMLVHLRHFVDTAAERVGPEMFEDPAYAAIFSQLIANDADAGVDEIAAHLDDESTAVLQELLNENGGLDRAEETVNGSINSLRSRDIALQMAQIDRELPLAEDNEKDHLIVKKQKLLADMRALGQLSWKKFGSSRA